MNGLALGIAMLVSSTVGSPAVETSRATILPAAFTLELPDDAAASGNALWRRTSFPPAQGKTASRFSKTERIIAVAAGVTLGWVAGGAIGYAITSKSNSADDVSGLRGVVIGAPIGAIIGGFIGYRLTK